MLIVLGIAIKKMKKPLESKFWCQNLHQLTGGADWFFAEDYRVATLPGW